MDRLRALFVICAALALAATAGVDSTRAQDDDGEDVRSDISAREIAIESNFTGARIVVFGAVENSRQEAPESGLYDIVVVIRGPDETFVTRRKERVFGIWINLDAVTFEGVPGFYAALSTRPIDEIASPETLQQLGIGFDSLRLAPKGWNATAPQDNPFRDALVRIKQREGLYVEASHAVAFVSRSLFRATLDLPASVPVGEYQVMVYLFRDGRLLSSDPGRLSINKEGFERYVFTLAFDYPLLYGLIAVVVAIAAGLIASQMFRRD